MTRPGEVLTAISRAERAAAEAVRDARAETERRVATAEAGARRALGEARARGLALADERHAAGLHAAQREAERIRTEGDATADRIRRGVDPLFADVVDAMVALVVPLDGA